MDELNLVSPLDGRYYSKLLDLSKYFSEFALIKKRIYVELRYLIEIGKAKEYIMEIHDKFDLAEAKKVKDIEKTTNHDLKAVEYYIKEKVQKKIKEFVHYGLTSEDINNIAYSLLLKEFIKNVLLKKIDVLLEKLKTLSQDYRKVPMLGHTHGQAASPTTLGKEFFVFYSRLSSQAEKLSKIELTGKLNGATGNYNALAFVEPKIGWRDFSRRFISGLGLKPSLVTTQIEPHDTLVEIFHIVKRINNIVMDLDIDSWLYISKEYLCLKRKEGEVGSSTMPHKINPIDFENSEGNIKIANSLFTGFESLQISRMQRDLSDSTVMRNIGVAFGHTILAYDSAMNGLEKIIPNLEKIDKDLEDHPEVLAEAVQTVLRKNGKAGAYEKLKDFSRGNKITLSELHKFIDGLDTSAKEKSRLKALRVRDYIGLADKF